MSCHRLFCLVAGCLTAFACAGKDGVLNAADHLSTAPRVEVRWLDGALRLAADCSGCVEDVRLLEWIDADAGGARRPLAGTLEFDAGARDVATAKLAPAKARAIAVDVVVDWRDVAGSMRQQKTTFFARVDARGHLQPITWAEFAIARGFAKASSDADGSVVLALDVLGAEVAQ